MEQFGRWTVLSEAPSRGYEKYVFARCSCGVEKKVHLKSLRRGLSKSCGCLQAQLASVRATTHGLGATPEYGVWKAMISRCTDPKNSAFHNYGGRGITVCDEWLLSPEQFLKDMSFRPSDAHTIERKDGSKGYSPGNCVWADRFEQAVNVRMRRDNALQATGVYWDEKRERFILEIVRNKRALYYGRFLTLEEAVARRKAVLKVFAIVSEEIEDRDEQVEVAKTVLRGLGLVSNGRRQSRA